ncbi:BTAD domain-containing putative transcriptional regulator [Streptomyces sp. NPDC047917]|uniref:AfsR/SARP family transcriptional regulator n=1 Tax=Streptomyces sp. NPDC047917 TaxID=3365491 RepID=UPI00371E10EC
MYFKVLGALDVSESTQDLTPSAPKLRSTLSLLLLRQGDIVRKDLFVDELWGVDPPPNALTTLQTYVYQLRRTLPDPQTRRAGHRPRGHAWKEATAGPSHRPWLRTTSSGYCASIPPETIDLCRFETLAAQGGTALRQGNVPRAAELLEEALTLWRGPLVSNVKHGPVLEAHATGLTEERLRVVEQCVDAQLFLGRYHEVLTALRGLLVEHPLAEGLWQRLLLALYRSGRRLEAIQEYRRLHRILGDGLGLEPSRSVQRLYEAVLASDPAPDLERIALSAWRDRAVIRPGTVTRHVA